MNSLIKAALVATLFLTFCCSADALTLKIGDVPPDYLGKDLDGHKVLVSENRGKLVIVSFWASWCPPCRKEIPILGNLQSHLGSDLIKVVAVNFKEGRRQYRKISKAFESSAVTLTHDRRGSIGKKYGVSAIPHLVVIDKEGKVAYQTQGYGEGSVNVLVEIVNKLLNS